MGESIDASSQIEVLTNIRGDTDANTILGFLNRAFSLLALLWSITCTRLHRRNGQYG
jgi:hypothetical protein